MIQPRPGTLASLALDLEPVRGQVVYVRCDAPLRFMVDEDGPNALAYVLPRPDLVVWPENSTDIDPFADSTVYDDIQGAVDAVGVPVLVGAMVSGEEPEDVYNQGIVWDPVTGAHVFPSELLNDPRA